MTDEHIIPEEIGGRPDFTIRVCRACNNDLGSRVDSKLTRHVGLRFMAMSAGCFAKRNDRLEGFVNLKDGRQLAGHCYWEELQTSIKPGTRSFRVAFDPKRVQPDGSRWVSEKNHSANSAPPCINVLRDEMIAGTGLPFDSGAGEPIQPAMLKIVLGAIHYALGSGVTSLAGFDSIRHSIASEWDSKISKSWVDVQPPIPCDQGKHLVWFGCEDGKILDAGAILWGKVASRFSISDFGRRIASHAIEIVAPRRWNSV